MIVQRKRHNNKSSPVRNASCNDSSSVDVLKLEIKSLKQKLRVKEGDFIAIQKSHSSDLKSLEQTSKTERFKFVHEISKLRDDISSYKKELDSLKKTHGLTRSGERLLRKISRLFVRKVFITKNKAFQKLKLTNRALLAVKSHKDYAFTAIRDILRKQMTKNTFRLKVKSFLKWYYVVEYSREVHTEKTFESGLHREKLTCGIPLNVHGSRKVCFVQASDCAEDLALSFCRKWSLRVETELPILQDIIQKKILYLCRKELATSIRAQHDMHSRLKSVQAQFQKSTPKVSHHNRFSDFVRTRIKENSNFSMHIAKKYFDRLDTLNYNNAQDLQDLRNKIDLKEKKGMSAVRSCLNDIQKALSGVMGGENAESALNDLSAVMKMWTRLISQCHTEEIKYLTLALVEEEFRCRELCIEIMDRNCANNLSDWLECRKLYAKTNLASKLYVKTC